MNEKWRRLLAGIAVVALVALVGAGCGDDDSESTASGEMEMAATGTDTGAATLRADLTHLLTEHVELAGISVVQASESGLDSPQFAAAAKSLDANSQDLAEAIGSVYGEQAGKQFLELWRSHIEMFVDYAEGRLTGDEKQAEQALADLDGYRQDFGAFLASANPNLTREAVAAELKPHVASLTETIDLVASGEGNPFVALQEAASHMPGTAAVLAGAIAAQEPEMFDGSAEDGAAQLRSDLTYLLDQHTYAAAIAIVTALGNGPDSPETGAATEALDDNSQELAATVASVYGKQAGDQFLDLWNAHIGFFVDYALAGAEGDTKAQAQARKDLDGYREDFGAFLASANPNLTKEAVAEGLEPHVESVFTVIDAALAGEATVFADLREAAGHMPELANTLAGAIYAQFPEKFGGGEASGGGEMAAAAPMAGKSESQPGESEVAIRTFMYEPDPVEVEAGTTVRWTNEDEILHTVTAGTRSDPGKEFDEQVDGAGSTAEVSFDQPGTFDYFCTIHDGMDGQVVVN